MTLTPKDWKSFQHYKERRPPWIKLHRTLLDNIDFQRLPLASKALAPMLWLLAAEYENGMIAETLDDIAFRLRMTLEELESALQPLIDKGFFALEQSASAPLADCKMSHAPKTETEEETEIESRSVKARPAQAPSRFEEFWKECPRRDGANPRKPAEARFNSLVKTGLDPQMLIDEAIKWRKGEEARGKIGTQYVARVTTWLNEQRWSDHAAVAALQAMGAGPSPEVHLEKSVEFFARTGIWSRHAGPEPGLSGCRASPELLAKYGLGGDGRKLNRQSLPAA